MSSPQSAASETLVEAVGTCFLCGGRGTSRYTGLRDYTFGAPGQWNYCECFGCGLLWLNPRPAPNEIGAYYHNYYTHNGVAATTGVAHWKVLLKAGCAAALLRRPGAAPGSVFWRLLGQALISLPVVRQSAALASGYVGRRVPGAVLDVGCGNGDLLRTLQRAGWTIAGIEPDPEAARVASERLGVKILPCALHEAAFPDKSFDAVTMIHVIEHVFEPLELVRESARLLRHGGNLIVVTPNINSFGHRHFGRDWRGLEPPRHLHLFSRRSLRRLAEAAGMRVETLKSVSRMTRGIWSESHDIRDKRAGQRSLSPPAWLMQAYEAAWNGVSNEVGEELVLIASME